MWMTLAISIAGTVAAWAHGDVIPVTGDKGLGFASPDRWLAPGSVANLVVSLAAVCVMLLLIDTIYKVFNVMRAMSALPVSLAALMLMATPSVEGQLTGGLLIAIVLWSGAAILFSSFGGTGMQRRIFLIFFMVSLASLSQYAFVLYVPALLVGTVQMRVFGPRTLLGAAIGAVTPLWILFGFGILHPGDLSIPEFTSVFSTFDAGDTLVTVIAIGVTAILAVIFISANFFKFIAYNARIRGYTGFLTTMTVWTVLLIGIDFTNALTYVPMLVTLTACQAGHYYNSHREGRSYIAVLIIAALYLGLYTCNIAI